MQTNWKKQLRIFIIELVLYGILVVVYFLVALRYMGDLLLDLFKQRPVVYAFVALLLIVAQGYILELVTSFLMKRLNLERVE